MRTPRPSTRSPGSTISCVSKPRLLSASDSFSLFALTRWHCRRTASILCPLRPQDSLVGVRRCFNESPRGDEGPDSVNLLAEPKSPRFNFSRQVTRFERAGDGDTTQAKGINQKRSVCPRQAKILAKLAANAESTEEVFDFFLRNEDGSDFPNTDTTQSLNRAEGRQGGFLKRLLESCASITTRSVRG